MSPPPQPELTQSQERRAWTLLLLLATVLRLAGLGHRAMSHDESLHTTFSWYLATRFHYQHDPMMHGPLLFHLNALVYRLLWVSDATSRLVPALAGIGTVAAVRLYRRWLGSAGSLAAAALIALNPGLLTYSRYIRNESMIGLATLLLYWAFLRYLESGHARHLRWGTLCLALLFLSKAVSFIHGFVMGALLTGWALLEYHRGQKLTLRTRRIADWALLLLTLALPFAAGLLHRLPGWDPRDTHTLTGQNRTFAIALILSALSFCLALFWFTTPKRFRIWLQAFALFWSLQLLLYTTLFSNFRSGLASGLAATLGYWLDQHEVQRGSPDPFFYLTLLLFYEPLLLLGFFQKHNFRRSPQALFALWALGHLLIYSWAGERMPWLLTHISLPLCLLAGPALLQLWQRRPRLRPLLPLLALHYLINSLRLLGPNADSVAEPMFFAHAGPEVKTALQILEHHLARDPRRIAWIHIDHRWPLAWYLRDLPAAFPDLLTHPPPEVAAITLPPGTEAPWIDAGWTSRGTFILIDWPRQHWHAFTADNFRALLQQPRVRRNLLRFYLFREVPPIGPFDHPQPNRFVLLTRET